MGAPTPSSRPPRLVRQADRTRADRLALYGRLRLSSARSILDVGCGDGTVTSDLAGIAPGRLVAIDNDPAMIVKARENLAPFPKAEVREADALALPFEDAAFDVTLCHLLLLWVKDPGKAVAEMARVTKEGGRVVAVMEPDYGGKIHEPENPVIDHVFADEAIRRRGGDPHMGRKLRELFVSAGLSTEVGLLNPEIPSCEEDLATYRVERGMYRKMLLDAGVEKRKVEAWEREYVNSLEAGIQFNYLPMFYAVGTKRGQSPEAKA